MFRVLGCVFEQHDLRLVALAGLLALFACATSLYMIRHAAAAAERSARIGWIASAGAVAGAGIWGTHFIGMLAYEAGFPFAYNIQLTLLSAALAMTMCGLGFAVALSGFRPGIGGAVIGAAIAAMHYIGMAAVHVPADAIWDWWYVAASIAIGIALTALAMDVAIRRGTVWAHVQGALVFTAAICGMHFTGMAAVAFRFNPLVVIPDAVLAPEMLAIAVAAVAVLIVALGLIGALVDSHLRSRGEEETRRLRAHIAELEATKSVLEETSQRLTEALNEAAAASRAKSAFFAAMSHELRTPLNAVIGFSEILAMETFGPLGSARYREYANDIHASGTHLLALINDILDVSRIDSGDKRLHETDLDLHDVVEGCMRMMETQAKAAGLALRSEFEPGVPRLCGDARRLKQILINLLANAVKFTPAGGKVAVRVARRPQGIVLAVEDTGIGMAQDDIPRALEHFGQIDSSLARRYEGAGIGLPLAKQLAELHGGALTVASQVHIGTVVTVTLPNARILEPAESVAL